MFSTVRGSGVPPFGLADGGSALLSDMGVTVDLGNFNPHSGRLQTPCSARGMLLRNMGYRVKQLGSNPSPVSYDQGECRQIIPFVESPVSSSLKQS